MILFQDSKENQELIFSEDLEGFKEIKSVAANATEKPKEFWDEIFSKRNTFVPETSENYFLEVFGRTSDEFHFDFDLNQKIHTNLEKFDSVRWANLTENEKIKYINDFSETLSETLGLIRNPNVVFFSGPEESCGAYNYSTNVISINRALLKDPAEVVDTIAHETWHAYQHQRAKILENKQDYLYKLNFDNYISPTLLGDGKYLFFTDYQGQIVEAEARAFANIFREEISS